MNKICTDLSQSKKLIELGIDISTADMWWNYYTVTVGDTTPLIIHIAEPWLGSFNWENKPDNIPAWSLGSLMALMPRVGHSFPELCRGKETGLFYMWLDEEFDTQKYSNPIDAAVEMIIWLNKNGKI